MSKTTYDTGNATDYSAADAAAIEAAIAEAWADYAYDDEMDRPYPTTVFVIAEIEWSGENRGLRPNGTHFYNLDLSGVIAALERARPAGSAAAAAAPLRSYRAKGWQAQLRQLSRTKKGRAAAAAAGLSPTPRTLGGWLTGKSPNRSNIARIHEAYRSVREEPVTTARESARRANRAVADALSEALRNEYEIDIRIFNIQHLELQP